MAPYFGINLYSVLFDASKIGNIGSAQGEYAWLEFYDDRRQLDPLAWEGRGAHLASTWYLGPVTFLAEATDYYRFDYAWNDPPTMEYPKTTFGHPPNLEDAVGARGRLDYVIPVLELGIYANYTNIQSHETEPEQLADHYSDKLHWQEWIEHTFGGFDRNFANGAYISGAGGYREIVEGRWIHGELDGETPIVAPHSITVGFHAKQFHGFGVMKTTEYASLENVLGYAYAPYFSITGIYEHSNETSGGTIQLGAQEEKNPHFWSVETMIKPNDWLQMDLAYGRFKGGLKCAGGVCRQIPPFEGFKSEFSVRF